MKRAVLRLSCLGRDVEDVVVWGYVAQHILSILVSTRGSSCVSRDISSAIAIADHSNRQLCHQHGLDWPWTR